MTEKNDMVLTNSGACSIKMFTTNWFHNNIEICNKSKTSIIAFLYNPAKPKMQQFTVIHGASPERHLYSRLKLQNYAENFIAIYVHHEPAGYFCINMLAYAGDRITITDDDIKNAYHAPTLAADLGILPEGLCPFGHNFEGCDRER